MATIIRDTKAGLSTLIRYPEESPSAEKAAESPSADRLIIFLHGWGAEGSDLMELASAIALDFPQAMFVAPDGPEPCSANPVGRQWFALDVDQPTIDSGPSKAMPIVTGFIAEMLAETHIEPHQVYLIGFSQGAMMALHVAPRLKDRIGGVVSFSGALLDPHHLKDQIISRPKVLLVHGRDDEVVPFRAMSIAETVLAENGVEVESFAQDGLGHGIDPAGFRRGVDFLKPS
jgi:phospholipase/carboxylesterase